MAGKKILTSAQEKKIEGYYKEGKDPNFIHSKLGDDVSKSVVDTFIKNLIYKEKGWETGVRKTVPKIDTLNGLHITKSFLKSLGFEFEKGTTFDWDFNDENNHLIIKLGEPKNPKE